MILTGQIHQIKKIASRRHFSLYYQRNLDKIMLLNFFVYQIPNYIVIVLLTF